MGFFFFCSQGDDKQKWRGGKKDMKIITSAAASCFIKKQSSEQSRELAVYLVVSLIQASQQWVFARLISSFWLNTFLI